MDNLDLETLKKIKHMFDIQSDYSTHCNGYLYLCRLIKLEEARLESTSLPNECVKGWKNREYCSNIDKCKKCS